MMDSGGVLQIGRSVTKGPKCAAVCSLQFCNLCIVGLAFVHAPIADHDLTLDYWPCKLSLDPSKNGR